MIRNEKTITENRFQKFYPGKVKHWNEKNYKEDDLQEVKPDDDIEDPVEDEEPLEFDEIEDDEDEIGDDVIDELLNEYKKTKEKHDLYKFHRRKK